VDVVVVEVGAAVVDGTVGGAVVEVFAAVVDVAAVVEVVATVVDGPLVVEIGPTVVDVGAVVDVVGAVAEVVVGDQVTVVVVLHGVVEVDGAHGIVEVDVDPLQPAQRGFAALLAAQYPLVVWSQFEFCGWGREVVAPAFTTPSVANAKARTAMPTTVETIPIDRPALPSCSGPSVLPRASTPMCASLTLDDTARWLVDRDPTSHVRPIGTVYAREGQNADPHGTDQ
jgi:hypothetical protein